MIYNKDVVLKKGTSMLYKLFINYFRLRLLRIILNRVMGGRLAKTKNVKSLSLLTYGLELLATFYLNGKRKVK